MKKGKLLIISLADTIKHFCKDDLTEEDLKEALFFLNFTQEEILGGGNRGCYLFDGKPVAQVQKLRELITEADEDGRVVYYQFQWRNELIIAYLDFLLRENDINWNHEVKIAKESGIAPHSSFDNLRAISRGCFDLVV